MKYLTPKYPIKAIQYLKDGTEILNIINSLGVFKEANLIKLAKIKSINGCVYIDGNPIDDGDWLCNDDGYLDIIADSVVQKHYNVADNWDNGGFW